MKKLFLDMDGCIADFVEGACRLHKINNPYPQLNGVWDFVAHTGIPAKEFWDPMGQFFWANLDPTPDAKEIVSVINQYYKDDQICILSSLCATAGCVDGKKEWLRNHFPQLAKNALFGSAKHFLAHPKAVLVDDAEHNIDPFILGGGLGILLPRPWNKHHGMSITAINYLAGYLKMIV